MINEYMRKVYHKFLLNSYLEEGWFNTWRENRSTFERNQNSWSNLTS